MKHFKFFILLIITGLLFSGTSSAQAAYLKIGDIKGESQDAKHKEWIEVLSFSHGVAVSGAASGAARRRSAPEMQDFSFVKMTDKATPKLMELATKGQVIPEVIFEVTNSSRNPYYTITLSNVMITSVNNGGSTSGQSEISDQVSFNYEKITWTYNSVDARGGSSGKVTATYNVEKGM